MKGIIEEVIWHSIDDFENPYGFHYYDVVVKSGLFTYKYVMCNSVMLTNRQVVHGPDPKIGDEVNVPSGVDSV